MMVTAVLFFLTETSADDGRPPFEADFEMESVTRGLPSPWALAFPSRGVALVTMKGGSVESIDLETGKRTRLEGLPRLRSFGQGGLLDIALAPDFQESRELYLSFSEEHPEGYGTSIARARFVENPPRLADWNVIFSGNDRSMSTLHFGSRLAFDSQGYLIASVGERNERNRARELRNHGGKTIRMDRDGKPAPDNPFIGKDAAPELYTYGHRNAQGLAVHPETGKLWLHEHGPRGGDEINILVPGSDYGWPLVTYGREYSGNVVGTGATDAPGTVLPLLHWTPSIAPSGMAFYFGSAFPLWRGDLLVGALAGMELIRVDLDGERVVGEISYLRGWTRIRDVRVGPDGFVYLLSDGEGGGLWRLKPR